MADFEKPSLLPPALAVDLSMRALEVLIARLVELDLAPTLVYDFEHVTESALPHLGEQFHVMGAEGWRLATTPEQRRALLARAVALHRHKGTPWSIREALKSVGFKDMNGPGVIDPAAMPQQPAMQPEPMQEPIPDMQQMDGAMVGSQTPMADGVEQSLIEQHLTQR